MHGSRRLLSAQLHVFVRDWESRGRILRVRRYLHGARLEAILGMSRLTDRDYFGVASLPSDGQLALHADPSFGEAFKSHTGDL